MIYVTGDTHGEIDIKKLNMKNFPEQKEMTKQDYVIIAGDFGCLWSGGRDDTYWLDWLENKNFTTLWIDGNHENFTLLNEYPVTEWNGGKIHQIRSSIFHLMRGQIFQIEGKSFFTFGGAYSIDKHYRRENVSWWKEEIPSKSEFDAAIETLYKHNMSVDYVITHTAPISIIEKLLIETEKISDPTASMLEFIAENLNFTHWYFGHFHVDKDIEKYTALYRRIKKIESSVAVQKDEAIIELAKLE